MIENSPSNVSAAFEILLEQIEIEVEFFNDVGKKAFDGRNYDRVREAVGHADAIIGVRDRIAALRKDWENLAGKMVIGKEEEEAIDKKRRDLGRLKRGLRTPELTFRVPILKALDSLGGSGAITAVLDHVEQQMGKKLNKYDREPLGSDESIPRWRNSAAWCRKTMVDDGLLKNDSPRGTWEITEKGRAALAGSA